MPGLRSPAARPMAALVCRAGKRRMAIGGTSSATGCDAADPGCPGDTGGGAGCGRHRGRRRPRPRPSLHGRSRPSATRPRAGPTRRSGSSPAATGATASASRATRPAGGTARPMNRQRNEGGQAMSETMGEYLIIERPFGNLIGGNMRLRQAVDRLRLGRGAGLFPRRRLPPVQRHPQQPHHALRARPYRPRRARSASTASPATTPTATPATCRAGWSPASMAAGASRAPSSTARSSRWSTAGTASG